jgi:hypothetical protein
MALEDITVYDEAGVLPNITPVTPENPLPTMLTEVPLVPAWVELGETAVMAALRSCRGSHNSAAVGPKPPGDLRSLVRRRAWLRFALRPARRERSECHPTNTNLDHGVLTIASPS